MYRILKHTLQKWEGCRTKIKVVGHDLQNDLNESVEFNMGYEFTGYRK